MGRSAKIAVVARAGHEAVGACRPRNPELEGCGEKRSPETSGHRAEGGRRERAEDGADDAPEAADTEGEDRIEEKHLPGRCAEAAEESGIVELAANEKPHGRSDAEAAEKERDQADNGQKVREAAQKALAGGRRFARGLESEVGIESLFPVGVLPFLNVEAERRPEKGFVADPAAGLKETGFLEEADVDVGRRREPKGGRGRSRGLGEGAGDGELELADADAVAGGNTELAKEERVDDDRPPRRKTPQEPGGIGLDFAVERIAAADGPQLDELGRLAADALSARARHHRVEGDHRRLLGPRIFEVGGQCGGDASVERLVGGERHVGAKNTARLVCEVLRQAEKNSSHRRQ